ncbi:hypothetical protein CLOP_g15214 [Closterium sp. NIES-67]|nr:hypothetical protein CLOP_g15214 [Closterium sp. NIES-67]
MVSILELAGRGSSGLTTRGLRFISLEDSSIIQRLPLVFSVPRSPALPALGSRVRGGVSWPRNGAGGAVGGSGAEGVAARAQGGGGSGRGETGAADKGSGGGGLDDIDFAVFRFTLGLSWLDDRDIPKVVGTLLGVALLTNHMLTPQPQLPAQTVSECVGVLLVLVSLLLPFIDRKLQRSKTHLSLHLLLLLLLPVPQAPFPPL